MADSFEFTIQDPTVELAADRTGAVAIDVTSRLDRHTTIALDVVAGDADAAWFEAPTPAEFDLATGSTLRTTVPIAVPANAVAGEYAFTVRAYAIDEPQRDFTTSPSVVMTVPEPAARSGIPWWVFALIAALVVIILVLAAFALFSGDDNDEPVTTAAPVTTPAPVDGLLMPIEDVFTITGRGTVVTGTIETGMVCNGDVVVIKGGIGIETVVSGVEGFGALLDCGTAGENVGVLLRGIDADEIEPGHVLVGP